MKIGTCESKKGCLSKGWLDCGELAMSSPIRMPVMILEGEHDGPVLWINSTVHGVEVNGIVVCKDLANELDPKELHGTVIFTPVNNPTGLEGRHKFTMLDRLDMDQQYPGNPNGWHSERVAYIHFEEVKKYAQYLISLHALGLDYDVLPYTIYKRLAGVDEKVNQAAQDMAVNFGYKAICEVDLSKADAELPGNIAGNLDCNCLLQGIPAIMAETGAASELQWDMIEDTKKGIRNVMASLGMIDQPVVPLAKDRFIVTKRKFPGANRGGLLAGVAKAGELMKPGDTFVKIFNALEDLEDIKADGEWLPLAVSHDPVVDSGEVIGAVALEWRPVEE